MSSLLILALAPLALAGGEERLAWAALELHGPLQEVRLDCGAAGRTRIAMDLAAGEALKLRVPLPLGPGAEPGSSASARASLEVRGSGIASLGPILTDPGRVRFERLPVGLRTRPRPPVEAARARAGIAEILLVVLGFLAVHARRSALAVGAAAAIGGLVFVLASRRVPEPPVSRVIEMEAGWAEWIEIEGQLGALDLPERLEIEPGKAPLELDLELVAGRLGGRVRAPGVRLYGLRIGMGDVPSRAANKGPDLERCATRSAAGEWLEHGSWPRGEPLPAGAPLRAAPPGWLSAGCAPGRTVLLALRRDGAWVRVLGF
jgi:hypothetical protein